MQIKQRWGVIKDNNDCYHSAISDIQVFQLRLIVRVQHMLYRRLLIISKTIYFIPVIQLYY